MLRDVPRLRPPVSIVVSMTTGETHTTSATAGDCRGKGITINTYAVKDFRVLAGLTAAQLAREVGVGRPYISLIENGHRNTVSPTVLNALVKALHINRRSLLANPTDGQVAA